MSVVEKPPVPLQSQLVKVWAYVQNSDGTFSPAPSSSGGATSNVNLTGINGTAPGLTNPLAVELSDGTNPFGTSGNPVNVSLHAETTKVIGTVNQGTSPWVVSGTVAVSNFPATQPISGTVAVTQSTSPWVVSNAGTFAVQSAIADGADVTQGAKADAKSTATDTTPVSIMSVLKEISFMEQNPASRAVTNAGTFAVQAAQSGNWTSRTVGNIGGVLDAVLGAAKPANVLQVGGNDGTNAFAMPLASGGGSVVVSGTVTATTASVGATGSAVPASANYDGLNVAGNLRGATASNPSGSIYAQNMDIASILGVTAVAASAGVLKVGVVGNAGAAFDAPVTGTAPANVVYQGDRAATTFPTAATDGQIVAVMSDKAGRGVVVANAPRDLIGTSMLNSNSSSAVSFITAGGSGVFNDIISLIITNESSTATIVSLSDNGSGGTVYKFALAANGGIVINFPTPLPQGTSNAAWDVLNSAAVACDYIAVFAKNK